MDALIHNNIAKCSLAVLNNIFLKDFDLQIPKHYFELLLKPNWKGWGHNLNYMYIPVYFEYNLEVPVKMSQFRIYTISTRMFASLLSHIVA